LIPSSSDKHFLHTNVVLRHANGDSGEAEQHIETILTEAAVAKRRVWVSSILFAELRPSMFVAGRFDTLFELTRYLRSLATLVTPDPNTMLRVARLRDAKWQRPAAIRQADEQRRAGAKTECLGGVRSQLARRSGQRALDLDDSHRQSVLTVLRSQAIPAHWVQMVEEVSELEGEEQSQMFGESLPIGLRLLPTQE